MKLSAEDSGVSPVIGTILLVAITVVLVAIIAAVVMGMAGSVSNTKNVGLTVTQSSFTSDTNYDYLFIGVTIFGGEDVSELRSLNVSLEGATGVLFVGPFKNTNTAFPVPAAQYRKFSISDAVGQTFYYTPCTDSDDRTQHFTDALCTVTGTFADGTSSVLYQSRITYDTPPGEITAVYGRTSETTIKTNVANGNYVLSPEFT